MDMFKPEITLWAEPDGEYSIHATTLVPLSGYVAIGARPGAPPANVKLTPETFPILLLLRQHESPGFQVPRLRTWHVHNQNLGGKARVLAFVTLVQGKGQPMTTLGQASVPVAASFALPTKEPGSFGSEWHAWTSEDKKTLHVHGVVQTPTPGYKVSLAPSNPQGINPKVLLLDLNVEKLPGIWPQHVVHQSVSLALPNHHYTTLHIQEPNGHGTIISLEDQI